MRTQASHLTLGAKRRLIKLNEDLQGEHAQLMKYASNWKSGTTFTKQVLMGSTGKFAAGSKQQQSFLLEKMQLLIENLNGVLTNYKHEVYRLALFDAKKRQYWLEIAKTGAQSKDEGHHHHHNMFASKQEDAS